MSIDIIRDRLAQYDCKNELEEEHALREITQEIILMGLARQNFFDVAEFHGGTLLRIWYGMKRFSEDLDFALLSPNKKFSLMPYLKNLGEELSAFGYNFEIINREKVDRAVKAAFLKDDSIGQLLQLEGKRSVNCPLHYSIN
jgi:predicted nucleotidyltransferase component of viral defense system